MAVNADVGLLGVVIVPPVPETIVHRPVPTVGVLPANVAVVPQMFWSSPAFAVVGLAVNVITTSSVEAVQGALAIVQRNVYVVPAVPANAEVGLLGVVTVPPAPEMMLQDPVPIVGVFAAKVTELPQTFWSSPALATVGVAVIVTGAVVENCAHPPAAAMVYVTVYVPAVLKFGVMAPVEELIERPAVDEYVPPVVPVKVTACAVPKVMQ